MATKHSIVKQAIQSRILDGTFLPHQKISSESELMKEFGVSRHTVRLAIGDLVNKGWLYREQGAGTFCADRQANGAVLDPAGQKNIALITTYISDYIFPSIIRGAESVLSEQGYHVTLFSTNNNHQTEREILEKILSGSFDGVIVEPTKSAFSNPNINYYLNLERQNIPYVMMNAYYDELEPLYVAVDDERGGFLQTEFLIKQGYRNIAGFFKTDDIQGVKRMKGFLKAHRKHRIPIEPQNIITYYTEEKESKPAQELDQLLKQQGDGAPDSLVCYNDQLALSLLNLLREKKLRVPDDIAMVGYDDSFLADVSEVKLTTVTHPKSDLGREAARLVLELVQERKGSAAQREPKQESILFEPELHIRSSVKIAEEAHKQ
ncbi:GntR family transcriptional regulator [Domibacillus sp. DTU_2020_1001157_1_SI_ALB_TIR_016]|uniref:GntR family transcriptional regulator n=1 Tax=Domibacillus sp. DTU_2020_1001157_1_SI_ALB_TIR_016 TaxID=3077789 RepID=UPI0028E5DBB4|nr:GntR family transcriptional regulator [Domibacillus sp. DTU_2020_1001157_1_SI_ALB_TIR_016]WNS80605.1 GntR family transcriptional regulator [Domibacillus sp. DTU_2020_1001157_1_SI_ALB_TIR_016]